MSFAPTRAKLLAKGATADTVDSAEQLHWALALFDLSFATLHTNRDGHIRFSISLSTRVGDRLRGYIMQPEDEDLTYRYALVTHSDTTVYTDMREIIADILSLARK